MILERAEKTIELDLEVNSFTASFSWLSHQADYRRNMFI